MPVCWAAGCSNRTGSKQRTSLKDAYGENIAGDTKVRFLSFPWKNQTLLKQWVWNCGREGAFPSKESKICGGLVRFPYSATERSEPIRCLNNSNRQGNGGVHRGEIANFLTQLNSKLLNPSVYLHTHPKKHTSDLSCDIKCLPDYTVLLIY